MYTVLSANVAVDNSPFVYDSPLNTFIFFIGNFRQFPSHVAQDTVAGKSFIS